MIGGFHYFVRHTFLETITFILDKNIYCFKNSELLNEKENVEGILICNQSAREVKTTLNIYIE